MLEHRMILRRATLDDIDAMLAVKKVLMMPLANGATPLGGFLLGSSREQYALFVEHAVVYILEDSGADLVAGFSIALPDSIIRASDLWQRKEMIAWHQLDWKNVEQEKVGYFEQLAVVPERRYRLYAPALALRTLLALFESGHHHLFTTVVRKPLHNLAAVPLLEGIGARIVGEIDEEYAEVGHILSDIYYLDRSDSSASDRAATTELGRRIWRMMEGMV